MRYYRSLIQWIGLGLLRVCEFGVVCLVVAAIVGGGVYLQYSRDLPDPAALGTHRPFETTRIYARDGTTLLYELFDGGQRTVIPLSEIPWALKAATVAVEDARFFSNPGFDLRGIVRAFYLNREGEVVSGGSTITQQLVRAVLFSAEERTEQSYRRKIREAILAFQLSREYSKEQILAMYLNEVYYGNMAYGIEAAAQSYFGHSAQTLDLAEASLLAGLPQSPTVLNPLNDPVAAKERQKIVLDQMVKEEYIDEAQARAAYAQTIPLRSAQVDIQYPHWVFYVRDLLEQRYGPELVYRGGLRVVTTLDPPLQDLAERAASEQVANLAERNAHNAAVVVMDPRTSEILAMVGSIDYNNTAIDGQVNVTLAERQPGSTLKPLVYAAALNRDWTPATIIWDVPTDFGGGYKPQNYDEQFHGPQRLRMALAGSLNIPAVKALAHVGLDAFLDLAHRMGITTLQDRDQYGLAVALGAGEVRLLDLTAAYTTFANGGLARPPVALLRVTSNSGAAFATDPEPALPVFGNNSAQVAYLITSILSDNDARAPIFGPDSVMRLEGDRPAAVKTGTSNDWKDSWAIGYTPDLVVGAWVGNNDNAPMQEVAGANGGGEIWSAIMEQAHVGKPPEPFERPSGIVDAAICKATGTIAQDCGDTVSEVFLAAQTPDQNEGQYVTVTVGSDGSCLATDATPLDQRRTVTFLQPPSDASGWAATSGLPRPPTVPCTVATGTATSTLSTMLEVAAITSPDAGALVGGEVTVRGSAAGQYILSYGTGTTPANWTTIVSGVGGVSNGLLGVWTTDTLPAGDYTLRLIVALPGSPEQETRIGVKIDNGSTAVRLLQPPPDAVVRQDTAVTLTAEASGPVSRVEFMVDNQVVGGVDGRSGLWTWTALGMGRHSIVAVAVSSDGKRVESQPVIIRVE